MTGNLRHKRIIRSIVVATATTIFSLFAATVGTYAWFSASAQVTVTGQLIKVSAPLGGCEIESVQLLKFDYGTVTAGDTTYIDYLQPENGDVNRYAYNDSTNTFGSLNSSDVWVSVDAMNPYDPVDRIISQYSYKDLNCNAVYEVAFTSSGLAETYLQLLANRLTSKTKTGNQIFLTDCVDFDIFTENDLLDSNPLFVNPEDANDNHNYYPAYFEDRSRVMSADEKLYYKVSYLASLKATHPNFYGTRPKPNSINVASNVPVTFSEGTPLKFYINVNYAPSQADPYMKDIYLANIRAIYDYSFTFQFTEAN